MMKFGITMLSEKVTPSEPILSGTRTGVTGLFKFDENINFLDIFQ